MLYVKMQEVREHCFELDDQSAQSAAVAYLLTTTLSIAEKEIINILKMIMMILGKYFIIDPLFIKIFPNGVRQKPCPKIETDIYWNPEKARASVKILQEHKSILDKTVNRNVKISRYLSK